MYLATRRDGWEQLYEFLLSSFAPAELRQVLYEVDGGEELARVIPPRGPQAAIAVEIVEGVRRRNLVGPLLDALEQARPRRRPELRAIREAIEREGDVSGDSGPPPVDIEAHLPLIALDASGALVDPGPDWTRLAQGAVAKRIAKSSAAVGRVEITPSRAPFAGTAFHIGKGVVLTASMVAREFMDIANGGAAFRPSVVVTVAFGRGVGATDPAVHRVEELIGIDEALGVAAFRLDPDAIAELGTPLTLATAPTDTEAGRNAVVIGHPSFPSSPMQQSPGDGTKHLSPARTLGAEAAPEDLDFAVAYSANTGPGMGGSPVIDLKSSEVLALHLGSAPTRSGRIAYGIRASEVSALLTRWQGDQTPRSGPPDMTDPNTGTMEWDDTRDPERLEEALAADNTEEIDVLFARLKSHLDQWQEVINTDVATRMLRALNRFGQFDRAVKMGTWIRQAGQHDYPVEAEYLRALVHTGRPTTALRLLDAVVRRLDRELGELRELGDPGADELALLDSLVRVHRPDLEFVRGEAFKRLYLEAHPNQSEPRDGDRKRASAAFDQAYRAAPTTRFIDGVESFALTYHRWLVLEEPVPETLRAKVRPLLSAMGRLARRSPDDLAALVQAQLIVGRNRVTEETLDTLLDHPDTTAYTLLRLSRQLRKVLGLRQETPPGSALLPRIQARLAQLAPSIDLPQPPADYEAIWGDVAYKPVQWLAQALKMSRAVARLGPSPFVGRGTGFRFDGSAIGDSDPGNYILTNAHVVSPDPEVIRQYQPLLGTMLPHEAVATFFADDGTVGVSAGAFEVVATSPPDQLDFTLLRTPTELEGVPVPQVSSTSAQVGDRVNIIGHPRGGQKSVSLQDNRVVRLSRQEPPRVYYRTPTEGGSSGSPVFDNDEWRVVALHHAGARSDEANRGIPIGDILQRLTPATAS